ncbi:peptide-methionine (S)-S-oxide reductase MsrA [Cyanobium sp. Cruz CV13-4-11]|jgi:peptide-methionine (S)-S-oxide reductase|uniref:peptide-methionine (S)-S-oxide reductase MsrA n=1 Tax=unclassified Cyanobium TaxID=2627006 RepID=UPI0020CBE19A|nr:MULTISPECIES: peptide-methionine (S)-S-oxide reductase MsrA [unclassified Cyanobium]MCP9901139.1 peptide-methionine (S)-S-oxide reductase MsrA [Cyanobium sp. Cruz CV11-17]MCP9920242.1 peptide-methionine (S)-S-oxide reductase MsrA [Cyanobium sp. Cruz CV13-4-11]
MRLSPRLTTASALSALAVSLLALPLIAAGLLPRLGASSAAAASLPDPATGLTLAAGPPATAVLAGGCFWGMEAVFEHLNGVTEVVNGYTGGSPATAAYDRVSGGDTGHAEGIRITYDPARVSYGQLLQVFFAVAHDPTQLNRQGPDVGSQYRSAIVPTDPEQRRVATAYIAQLNRAGALPRPIVTTVEDWRGFTPAEAYHQDFVARNPAHPYVVFHDQPKVARLKTQFPELTR